jgi:intracellular multiplication protein IcmT
MVQQPSSDAHWRDSARSARFFIFDAMACFPMLLLLFHIRLWTFILAISTMVFLALLGRYGFTTIVFARWLRTSLAGKRKVANPWWM